jgi:hypothetical protein
MPSAESTHDPKRFPITHSSSREAASSLPGEVNVERNTCAAVPAVLLVMAVLSLPAGAWAQPAAGSSPRGTYGIGYVFGGFGAVTDGNASEATLHVGGGGEAVFWDSLGVGAEIGFLGPFESLGDGVGVFSVNGSYHFLPNAGRRLRPFATGGYTLGFRDGTESLFNFGGGFHYWVKPKFGIRVEFRDHVVPEDGVHFLGARIGVVW